jgi:hypothetical protein
MAEDSTALEGAATTPRGGQPMSPYSTMLPLLRVQITRVVLRGIRAVRRASVVVRGCDSVAWVRGVRRVVVRAAVVAVISGLQFDDRSLAARPSHDLCRACTGWLDE